MEAYKYECWGNDRWKLDLNIEFPDQRKEYDSSSKIGRTISRTMEKLVEDLRMAYALERPTLTIERAANKEELLKCFNGQPIFVEEIPNQYCPHSCCVDKPWLIVTTTKGRIKIGWRKKVINIDWSDSIIEKTAEDLFPKEDVTKDKKLIHAWGYDKAKGYLSILLV